MNSLYWLGWWSGLAFGLLLFWIDKLLITIKLNTKIAQDKKVKRCEK